MPKKKRSSKGPRRSDQTSNNPGYTIYSDIPLLKPTQLKRYKDIYTLASPRRLYFITIDARPPVRRIPVAGKSDSTGHLTVPTHHQSDSEDVFDPIPTWLYCFYEFLSRYDLEHLGALSSTEKHDSFVYAVLNDLRRKGREMEGWTDARLGRGVNWMRALGERPIVLAMMVHLANARKRALRVYDVMWAQPHYATPRQIAMGVYMEHLEVGQRDVLVRETMFPIEPVEEIVWDTNDYAKLVTHSPHLAHSKRLATQLQASIIQYNMSHLNDTSTAWAYDRIQVLSRYHALSWPDVKANFKAGGSYVISKVAGEKCYSSITRARSLDTSDWIDIGTMRCPMRHQGSVLICRILTNAQLGHGICFAVEDRNGHAIAVNIENLARAPVVYSEVPPLAQMYARGTLLAIYDPYVHYGPTTNACEIYVTVPTDIEHLPLPGPNIKWKFACPFTADRPVVTSEGYRKEAKTATEKAVPSRDQAQHGLAAHYHTMAIAASDRVPSVRLAGWYTDLAFSLLHAGKPGPALARVYETEDLLKAIVNEEVTYQCKTRLQKVKLEAAYELRLWDLAIKTLKECDKLGMEAQHLEVYRVALKRRSEEAEGKYDWVNIRKRAEIFKSDVADYTSLISVETDPTAATAKYGRIVRLTHDVKAGDLILLEKAVYHASMDHYSDSTSFMVDAFDTGQPFCAVNLFPGMVQALLADPSRHAVLDTLCPGHTRVTPILKESKRIAMIKEGLGDIDIEALRRSTQRFMEKHLAGDWESETIVLFAASSLISQSCIPNAIEETLGDVKVVRARQDLKAGDVVTVDCASSGSSYLLRKYDLREKFGIDCDCDMCREDAQEDYMAKMELMKEWPATEKYINGTGAYYDVDGNELSPSVTLRVKEDLLIKFCDKLLALYREERPHESVWLEFAILGSGAASFMAHSDSLPRIEVDKWLASYLMISGGIYADDAHIAATGRMLTRIPPKGNIKDICPAMLHLAFLRQQSYIQGGDEEDIELSHAWVKTAHWAYKILLGDRAGGSAFTKMYQSQLDRLKSKQGPASTTDSDSDEDIVYEFEQQQAEEEDEEDEEPGPDPAESALGLVM